MRTSREGGGAGQAIIILFALVSLGIVYFITRKPEPPKTAPVELKVRIPEEVAPLAPAASTPEPAAPPPVVVQATPTPTPAPVVAATPPPAPAAAPLDLATVAVSPALWPPKVALLQPFSFPILLNGRVVGQAKAPAGTLLQLVRINGQHVEIEFQNVRHSIPAFSTDLMQRALQKLQSGASTLPQHMQSATAPPPSASSLAKQAPRTSAESDPAKIAKLLAVDVSPVKSTRVEGGDFDDKRDRFRLKVKFTNPDIAKSVENLKGEIYVFGDSLTNRNIRHVLAFQEFTFSLPARATHEVTTKEVTTAYDDSQFARFGYKYEGWFLRIRNSAGDLVLVKATTPTLLKSADKITGLKIGSNYDKKTFEISSTSTR